MESQEEEYKHNAWEIYRKEWATASPEKKTELNKRMHRWQELMKNGWTAQQAYYKAMEEELAFTMAEEPSDKSPRYSRWSSMPKVPSVILVLALIAAIVYSVVITGDRNALNTELESVQSVLASTQSELASTQSELTSTKLELDSTQSEFGSTKQTLVSTETELSSTKQMLASTNQRLSSVQSELEATKTESDAIDAKLKLYEDTLGIKIFSGVQQPPLRGASPIKLVNNPAATDPSWQQLISFLRANPTDDRTWTEGIFVSGDFAEMLHNNAEAAGIRAALVGVFFESETIGHGLNAFKTTDRGLVYVDCTGPTLQQKLEEIQYRIYGGTPIEWDKIAYMVKGKEFGIVSIDDVFISPRYEYYEEIGKSSGSGWGTLGIVESIVIYW